MKIINITNERLQEIAKHMKIDKGKYLNSPELRTFLIHKDGKVALRVLLKLNKKRNNG